MLRHLGIRGLAVVDVLALEFGAGLTVLTGETGAGKSILLTALGLALGDRADPAFVRPGASRAEIDLGVDLNDCQAAAQWLADRELDADGECLIRRIVGADGRSKSFINGRPVTLQALQELGSHVLEIHGQHAHVKLLRAPEQRRLLDEAAGNQELLNRTGQLYREWQRLEQEWSSRTGAARDQAAREDLLRYQIDELEQADVLSLDYQALVEEQNRLANIGKILTAANTQLQVLYEDETRSVDALLSHAVQALDELSTLAPELAESTALLAEAQVQVVEAARQLRRNLEHIEADPARLEWVEQRLGAIHQLARKHRVAPAELASHAESLRRELEGLVAGADGLDALRTECDRLAAEFRAAAQILSERRRAAAAPMQARITAVMRELGMPQGQLRVQVSNSGANTEPSATGLDQVDFLVSTNPGLPPRPLARVASGGELSRISLAIQVAALAAKTVPTLVFDEVDTGIGGGVAEIVGQKLRLLGENGRQVFCVTHLPQVAAQGHQHLLVEKLVHQGGTRSTVRTLEGADRVTEIARMLGGIELTRQTLAHAEEMLCRAGTTPVSPEGVRSDAAPQ